MGGGGRGTHEFRLQGDRLRRVSLRPFFFFFFFFFFF